MTGGCDADVCMMGCHGPYGEFYVREGQAWGGIRLPDPPDLRHVKAILWPPLGPLGQVPGDRRDR